MGGIGGCSPGKKEKTRRLIMIQLTDHGVYLVNGAPLDSVPIDPEVARKETMAWKILQAHNTSGDPN